MPLDDIRTTIQRLVDGAPMITERATSAACDPVVQSAKDNLFPGHGYDTGALQESLDKELAESNAERVVYRVGVRDNAPAKLSTNPPPVAYAEGVEFGNSKRQPIPYLRPAADQNHRQVHDAMIEELSKGISELVRGVKV